MNWFQGPNAAFEPPSDFSGGGGGSSTKKKMFIVGGIGCGVVLLLIGILFAAGAFQAVSCCNQAQEFAQNSQKAQGVAVDFGLALSDKDFERALAMTSENYRSKNSLQTFTAGFDPFAAYLQGTPRVFNFRAGTSDEVADSFEDLNKGWTVVLQYATANSDQQLLVEVDVIPTETGELVIDNVGAEVRARSLASEPPAREVIEVHDDLAAGRYEMAHGRMAQPFKQETNIEAFKAFINDSNGVMTSSDVTIEEVDYSSQDKATVMATVRGADGNAAVVQYELVSPVPGMSMWKIMAISTPVRTDDVESVTGEPVMKGIDAGGADADVIAPELEEPAEGGDAPSNQ